MLSERIIIRNSARLAERARSYAFSCSPFAVHARQFWPTSDNEHLLFVSLKSTNDFDVCIAWRKGLRRS